MSHFRYVNQLLQMRCAGDVLGVVGPMKEPAKEISEAMAIIRRIKPWTLENPMKYTLVDLCSGNAFVPVISAFSLPVIHSHAVDKRPRNRPWDRARRFTYNNIDIGTMECINFITSINGPVILTAVHPCGPLATQVVALYNICTNVEKMVVMPCCVGKTPFNMSDKMESRTGRDNLWAVYLAGGCGGKIIQDDDVISPKNRIIIAEKNENQDTRGEESTP